MDTDTNHDGLAPLAPGGRVPFSVPIGTIVGRWDCPSCDRSFDVVRRPGRPRVYCSQACRQRAYVWRRDHDAHTRSEPHWPAESASVPGGRHHHALRTPADPLSRRSDRRGREVTACGVLAHAHHSSRSAGNRTPFRSDGPSTCRRCAELTAPRPLGLVPPGAMPPPWAPTPGTFDDPVRHLRLVAPDYPLDPRLRRALLTVWAA